jgi:hypothetical protein
MVARRRVFCARWRVDDFPKNKSEGSRNIGRLDRHTNRFHRQRTSHKSWVAFNISFQR